VNGCHKYRAKIVVRSEIPAGIGRPTIVRHATFREVVDLILEEYAENAGNTDTEREGALSLVEIDIPDPLPDR